MLSVFRYLVTHSETDWSSVKCLVYFDVAADVYTVESLAYIDTQALFKVSGRSFVKTDKDGPDRLPCVYHTRLNLHEIGFH
jgi:hypothetical protein